VTGASRSRNQRGRAAIAALLLAAAAAVVATASLLTHPGEMTERGDLVTLRHTVAATVPRLTESAFTVADAGTFLAFDLFDNEVYLLDAYNRQVQVFRRDSHGTWRMDRSFGRPGSGPGEFRLPSGLAVARDGSAVVVAEEGQLHFFSVAGEFLRSARIRTACTPIRPAVAAAADGFLLIDTCMRGPAADSLMSVLSHTSDGLEYREVAVDVEWVRAGSVGSFLSQGTVGTGVDRHTFGTGVHPCFHVIEESDGVIRATRQCGIISSWFSAAPSSRLDARLRERRRERPQFASLFTWPQHLPAYQHLAVTAEGDVLFRRFSPDSAVLRLAGEEVDLLVVPTDGFRGCRLHGCMWERPLEAGSEVLLLTVREIEHLIGTARTDEAPSFPGGRSGWSQW
jgi:hypothetical protein